MPRGIRAADGRPTAQQRERTLETFQFRLSVLNFFENCGQIDKTLSKFFNGVSGKQLDTKRKSIYYWRKHRAKIELMCKSATTARSCRSREIGTGTTLPAEAEERLVMWVNGLRSDSIPVSHMMLHVKALEVVAAFEVSAEFSATWSWRTSFVRRHGLSFRAKTGVGQVTPEDADAVAEAFGKKLKTLMDKFGVDHVFNVDQTAVAFEYVPKTTINKKGTKTVWVRTCGQEKDRVTVMLLGDSFGRRYTPFVVMKMRRSKSATNEMENARLRHGFGKRVWPEIDSIQNDYGMQVHANDRDWWNSSLSLAFLEYHFGSRSDMDRPVLLLLDDFSGHWTDEVTECARRLNVELVKVPPRYTSVCQPADIAWNRPLKNRLRKYWVSFMREQVKSIENDRTVKLKGPGRVQLSAWLHVAWTALSAETISNGFKGILSNYDADESSSGSEEQGQLKELVTSLEQLDLLDKSFGELDADSDVVDTTLSNDDE